MEDMGLKLEIKRLLKARLLRGRERDRQRHTQRENALITETKA